MAASASATVDATALIKLITSLKTDVVSQVGFFLDKSIAEFGSNEAQIISILDAAALDFPFLIGVSWKWKDERKRRVAGSKRVIDIDAKEGEVERMAVSVADRQREMKIELESFPAQKKRKRSPANPKSNHKSDSEGSFHSQPSIVVDSNSDIESKEQMKMNGAKSVGNTTMKTMCKRYCMNIKCCNEHNPKVVNKRKKPTTVTMCNTDGCPKFRASHCDGYCMKCFNTHYPEVANERKKQPKIGVGSTTKKMLPLFDSDLGLERKEPMIDIDAKSTKKGTKRSKLLCQAGGCSKYRQSNCVGFCTRCFSKHHPDVANKRKKLTCTPDVRKSKNESDSKVGSHQPSGESEDGFLTTNAKKKSANLCMSDGCPKFRASHCEGYCRGCFNTHYPEVWRKKLFMGLNKAPPFESHDGLSPTNVEKKSQGLLTPAKSAILCISDGCPKFRASHCEGYCRRCFNKHYPEIANKNTPMAETARR